MALTPGTRIGVYDLTAPIGEGGMGQVYRARDTKLDRDVAIKILPEAFAQDADRLARFQREAKTLASLNHPNIAGIYGLEESAGVSALVMELVEGEELSQRIARGPIPLDEALPIAKQIAEALEAAHEQGIIHRDLKPANIKVRADGTVKVLDFGLAKASESGVGSREPEVGDALANSPTITSPAMTQAGVILGTAAYMSPEQAKGKPVDKRADIWAFGVVLYEMLSGKRAFDGEDTADTLAAVIRGEAEWGALPGNLPSPLLTLLRRSIEKDGKRRIADFSTVSFLLDESRSDTSDSKAIRQNPARSVVVSRAKVAGSIAATVILMAVVIWALRRSESTPPGQATRFRVQLPEGASLFVGTNPSRAVALSPDGSRLVVSARVGSRPAQLFIRSLDQLDATPVAGTDSAVSPAVSPDGRLLAYAQSGNGAIMRVPMAGGTPALVCRTGGIRGMTWLSGDTIVYADVNGGLKQVAAGGGDPLPLASLDPKVESAHAWPQALPGGRALLFNVTRANAPAISNAIVLLRVDTGERRVLVEGGSMPTYLDSGFLVFRRDGVLMAAPFDLTTFELRGPPQPALDAPVVGVSGDGAQVAVAASGTLAYVPGGPLAGARSLVWVDRAGTQSPSDAPLQNYEIPRLSPDGSKVLVSITGEGSGALRDVWMYDFTRGVLSRVTNEKEEGESATWAPDGNTITYVVLHGGRRDFVRRHADGSGTPTVFASSNRHLHSGSWTPDGTTLLAVVANGEDAGTIWTIRKGSAELLLRGPGQIQAPMLSPDGRWLAYTSNETSRFEVYVQAFPGPGAKYQVSSTGGTEPRWARSGRELFYRSGDDVNAVTVEEKRGVLQIGPPKKLFDGYFATVGGTNLDTYYDVTPDGRRFLMIKADDSARSAGVVVVRDWAAELTARISSK